MDKRRKMIGIILLVCVCVIVWGFLIYHDVNKMQSWNTTEEIADYGIVEGNGHNEIPHEFLMGFFPEQILPYFENVIYKYKAKAWCTYNCEMYLEFTISDP